MTSQLVISIFILSIWEWGKIQIERNEKEIYFQVGTWIIFVFSFLSLFIYLKVLNSVVSFPLLLLFPFHYAYSWALFLESFNKCTFVFRMTRFMNFDKFVFFCGFIEEINRFMEKWSLFWNSCGLIAVKFITSGKKRGSYWNNI